MYIVLHSAGCSKDYVQFYYGNSLESADLVRYSGYVEGRFCNARDGYFLYSLYTDTVTVYFHTDGSGSGNRGLKVSFTAKGNCLLSWMLLIKVKFISTSLE